MNAELLALLDSDPAAGILAVADLREQRAKAVVGRGEWHVEFNGYGDLTLWTRSGPEDPAPQHVIAWYEVDRAIEGMFEHTAAEANPAHALAAVRRWRGVVKRHTHGGPDICSGCGEEAWPCPDMTETADEARAYLGGTA